MREETRERDTAFADSMARIGWFRDLLLRMEANVFSIRRQRPETARPDDADTFLPVTITPANQVIDVWVIPVIRFQV